MVRNGRAQTVTSNADHVQYRDMPGKPSAAAGIVGIAGPFSTSEPRSKSRYEPRMISGPASSSSIVAGVTWVEHALLGTAATAIAVICVAGLGFAFLAGRVPMRRAITVLIGCFILFGAPSIAAGLSALASREPPSALPEQGPAPQFPVVPQASSRTAPDPFNPYSGE